MRTVFFQKAFLVIFILALSACAPVVPGAGGPSTSTAVITPTNPPLPTQTPVPTNPPVPTSTPAPTSTPTPPPLSFSPVPYKDDTAGIQLDYPAGWTLVPKTVIGSRGSQAQLLSPGTTAETLAAGGTRVGITIYKWDPKNDLAAYVTHRKTAWDGGGSTLVSETGLDLRDGRKAFSFIVQGPDKLQAFFLLTTVGEDYLEISGEGDLALIEEIARTLRPLE